MRVIPVSCQPGPKAFSVEVYMEFRCNWVHQLRIRKNYYRLCHAKTLWRHFEFCIGKLNLFSCDHLQTAITWINLCLQWSSVNCWLGLLWTESQDVYGSLEYLINTRTIPRSLCWSLLCLQWQRMASVDYSNVDSIHPTLHQDTLLCMNSPWNTYLGLDSPLLNTIDLRILWSYVFCKGVQMAIVAENVDNAGFNAIAKSSLLESVYLINQEKIVLHWTSRLQCCNFLHIGLFCLIFVFN